MKIAVAGKGGVGKSTLTALLALSFKRRSRGPLLLVDADPNSNLHMLMGIRYEKSIILSFPRLTCQKGRLTTRY